MADESSSLQNEQYWSRVLGLGFRLTLRTLKLWDIWYMPYKALMTLKLWELWYIPYSLNDPKLWEVMVYSLFWVMKNVYHQTVSCPLGSL